LYSIWIKIDKAFPWIELKGEDETKMQARQAAKMTISRIAVKLVNMRLETNTMKALVTVRAKH
jgi:hypothetical protein